MKLGYITTTTDGRTIFVEFGETTGDCRHIDLTPRKEVLPQTMTYAQALKIEEQIYQRLQERRRKARQAEAEYWDFLDEEDYDGTGC